MARRNVVIVQMDQNNAVDQIHDRDQAKKYIDYSAQLENRSVAFVDNVQRIVDENEGLDRVVDEPDKT